ncbi:MAG TPA: CBS domain-containing protein [Spongiibacteraceae bacterium]
MQVSEVMTNHPHVLDADDTALIAAQTLAQNDIGAVPVTDGERLIGMLTDRDIVVRVVAKNLNPADTLLNEIVSGQPRYCYEDEDTEHVASNMDELLVRRLPVVDRNKRLVGIVSIEDIRPRQAS